MAATVAEKIIRIDVVTSANAQRSLSALATEMKKVETATASMKRSVDKGFDGVQMKLTSLSSFLGSFGLSLGVGAVARYVIETANSFQVLESRLALVLGSYEKAERASLRIIDIAKVTGREIDGVAKLYEKASRSAQQFGISEEQVSEITLGFSQSIRLSGASTQEAYASLVQFGQALASGRLQGDEFRSLMENNAVFMYEFAKAAGVSVQQLRKMGTEGKLSAQFMFETMSKKGEDSLNMMQRLNKMAAEVPLTFRQSMESVGSALTEAIGAMTKLLTQSSDDKLGMFAPWIRGLENVAQQLREVKAESDALGEGFWMRLLRLGRVDFAGGQDAVTALYGALGGKRDRELTLLDRMKAHKESTIKDIERLQGEVSRATAAFEKDYGSSVGRNFDPRTIQGQRLSSLNEKRAELDGLLERYARIRAEERRLEYGEGFLGDPKVKIKAEPDAAAERKLKNARTSLEEFVQAKEREAETYKRVATGQEEVTKTSRDLVALEDKLKAAAVGTNSEFAKRGRAAIEQTEHWKKQADAMKEFEKSEADLREQEKTALERVQNQILRDSEAIDALHNRSRATDEFTEALLRQNRAAAESEILHMDPNTAGAGFRLDALRAYIAEVDKALAKKNELMGLRADKKQIDEQRRVDEENARRVDKMADDFNKALKEGIFNRGDGKSVGEALRDNIVSMVHNKTIDIIVNPVTTVFSRMLAQIADQFSAVLTRKLFEAMSNTSSDPLGTFIGLMGFTGGSASGAASTTSGPGLKINPAMPLAKGMSYVPYDNFPASLHRGERVLTARENKDYSRGALTVNSSPVINIDSRTDQAEIHRVVAQAVHQGNIALVEEMRSQGMIS